MEQREMELTPGTTVSLGNYLRGNLLS